MSNRAVVIAVCVAIATCVYGASIGSKGRTEVTSLQNVNVINNNTTQETGGTTTAPVPGKLNVCEVLCPKWCRKVEGSERNYTHCHYMCGNLCNIKAIVRNPFIGNARYEVVPSEYKFLRYDIDGNKKISVQEFASVEGIFADEAVDLFTFADINQDGFIDTAEFQGGPLVFTVQMAAELSAVVLSETPTDSTVQ